MRRQLILFLLVALTVSLVASSLYSVEITKGRLSTPSYRGDLTVSVRLTGGKGSVFRPGRDVRLSFQTNEDAFVVLYNIDSEGYVHLLFPEDGNPRLVRGRKVYFLPDSETGIHWEAGEKTGVEYFHAVAVKDREWIKDEELLFLAQNERLSREKQFHIDMDPFIAFNMIDEEILIDAENHLPATDYTYFYINRRVEYPRYLCSRCHGPGKISDPYAMECPEIVIEKITYEEDPQYPYPSLYEVSYVEDEDEKDYYISDRYVEERRDWDDDEDYEDTKVYLSIFYSDYHYPYRYYWPYFWTHISFYDPFYWDFYWYYPGWSWHYANYYYHYWPFYSWWYPYHYYWAYNYRYDWWYNNYHWCCHHKYRPIYAHRTIAKRRLNYARAVNKINRNRVLADNRLVKRRADTITKRMDRSRLSKRVSSRNVGVERKLRNRTGVTRSDVRRKVVYGPDRTIKRTRDATRSRDERKARTPVKRVDRDKSTTRRKSEERGRTVKRSTTRKRSSSTRKRSPSRDEGKSIDRSKSSTTKKSRSSETKKSNRSSSRKRSITRPKSTSRPKSSGSRKSSSSRQRSATRRTSSSRSRSTPARSSSRSSSSGRSSSRSSRSSGGSGKSRRR